MERRIFIYKKKTTTKDLFVICHRDELNQHHFYTALILCLYKNMLVKKYCKVANQTVFNTAC